MRAVGAGHPAQRRYPFPSGLRATRAAELSHG